MPQGSGKNKPENVIRLTESNLANIPQELKELPRWIGWKYEYPKPNAKKKAKRPISLQTGFRCDPTDHSNGVPFETAVKLWRRHQRLADDNPKKIAGLGFMLGAGIGGIDVDDCIDAQGFLNERGTRMSRAYVATYAEMSPSGQGFKVIVNIGDDPKIALIGKSTPEVEIYGDKRYFTVTGEILADHPASIAALPDTFEATAREVDGARPGRVAGLADMPDDTGGGYGGHARVALDEVEIQKILDTLPFNWCEDYGSWLKVGMALHHQWGGGAEGLALWDEYSKRAADKYEADACETKWQTFGKPGKEPVTVRTLVREAQHLGYVPPRSIAAAIEEFSVLEDPNEDGGDWWSQYSIGRLLEEPAPPRRWIFEDLLRRGKLLVLAGSGGSSKSYSMVTAGMQYVLGNSWGPFKIDSMYPTSGRVLALFAEEGLDDVHERVQAIATTHMLTRDQIATVRDRFAILPLRGKRLRLMESIGDRDVQITLAMERLEARIKEHNVELLILDPMTLLHNLEENDNNAMAEFVLALDALAARTDCAIILIHHFGKGGPVKAIEVNESNVRGASAIVAHARTVVVMHRLRGTEASEWGVTSDDAHKWVMFNVVKNNYGKTGAVTWLSVNEHTGVVQPAPFQLAAVSKGDALQAVRDERIRESSGVDDAGELLDEMVPIVRALLVMGQAHDLPSMRDIAATLKQRGIEASDRAAKAARLYCTTHELVTGTQRSLMTNAAGMAWLERHPKKGR